MALFPATNVGGIKSAPITNQTTDSYGRYETGKYITEYEVIAVSLSSNVACFVYTDKDGQWVIGVRAVDNSGYDKTMPNTTINGTYYYRNI